MSPRGGARNGAGRKPALSVGERKHFYLAPELRDWWGNLPERKRSEAVNRAVLDMISEQGEDDLKELIRVLFDQTEGWDWNKARMTLGNDFYEALMDLKEAAQ